MIFHRLRWTVLTVAAISVVPACSHQNFSIYRFVDSETGKAIQGDFDSVGDPRDRRIMLRPIRPPDRPDVLDWEVRWEGDSPLYWPVVSNGYEEIAVRLEPGDHWIALHKKRPPVAATNGDPR